MKRLLIIDHGISSDPVSRSVGECATWIETAARQAVALEQQATEIAALELGRERLRERVEALLAECPSGVVPDAAAPAWATLLNEARKEVLNKVLALFEELRDD